MLIQVKIITSREDVLILRPLDDLKMENVSDFLGFVFEQRKEEQKSLILDLSCIAFVDSPGVGALLKLHELMKKQGGRFLIFGMKRSLNTIFRLSGLLSIFEYLDEDEAKKNFPEMMK